MATPNVLNLVALIKLVVYFEELTHTQVQVRWQTNGRTTLFISDPEADEKRTHTFLSEAQAIEWLRPAVTGQEEG